MKYTAASVKAALESFIARKGFFSRNLDSVVCPMAGWIPEVEQECGLRPQNCQLAKDQECKRNVSILQANKKTLYITLSFYFTISATDYGGFIRANDKRLEWLVERGDISTDDLVVAE